MTIKKQFVLYTLLIVITSLSVVFFTTFEFAKRELVQSTVNKLEAVADISERRINEAVVRYIEQAKLVTSRTRLNTLVTQYSEDPIGEEIEQMYQIISDAKESSRGIQRIDIISRSGEILSSTDSVYSGSFAEDTIVRSNLPLVQKVFKDENNLLHVLVTAPFFNEGIVHGYAHVVFDADLLIEITNEYIGLERTGEVAIVDKNSFGDVRFLNPLRFDSEAVLSKVISKDLVENPAVLSLSGTEETFIGGVYDYRDKEVIAVTRFVESVGWGVVVKTDLNEINESLFALQLVFIITILIIGSVTVFVTLYSTNTISRPIEKMTLLAQKIRDGVFTERVEIGRTSKEVEYLAATLNDTATKLQEVYIDLDKRIRERTKQLSQKVDELEVNRKAMGSLLSDIEEEKEKFERVFADSAVGVALVALDGSWIDVNQSITKILGYSKKEILKLTFQDITHRDDLDADLSLVQQCIDGKIDSYEIEKRYIHKEGHIIWALLSVSIIRDSKSKPRFFVSQILDITHRKEVDQAKSEFVSLASHQLRTPLSAINWYTEMLLEGDAGKLSKEQQNYVREIFEGNQRMIALVNSLLNISRLELGTFTVKPELASIEKIVNQVVKEISKLAKKKKITLNKKIEEGIPNMLLDEKLTVMIIDNLLSNAIKYTPNEGEVSIAVSTNTKSLVIEVSDTGYGIPSSQRKYVFEKFFRADNVTVLDTEGTGLGLYLIKSILDETNGKISFKTKVNEGTTFKVLIPLKGMKSKEGTRELS